jgi:peroxiredoxin Q/BCP
VLTPGTKAPDFTLPDHDGRDRTLASLLADGPLVLYFYPADFSPACTAEACSFRAYDEELRAAGLSLAGISSTASGLHKKFREMFKLPFPLLADAGRKVTKAYDASMPFGLGTRRVTYLIDADGTIADGVEANFGLRPHKAFIERAIERGRGPAPAAPAQ